MIKIIASVLVLILFCGCLHIGKYSETKINGETIKWDKISIQIEPNKKFVELDTRLMPMIVGVKTRDRIATDVSEIQEIKYLHVNNNKTVAIIFVIKETQ